MRRFVAALLLAGGAFVAQAADAPPTQTVRGEGYRIQLPASWELQRDRMGLPLMARPGRAADPEGWGADLLTITVETGDLRRTCLDGYTLRRLQQIAYHASRFEKLEEEPLELGGAVATRVVVRYTEGPRELMAYVLVLQQGQRFVTATLSSTPARFEFQRAAFRRLVDSLRS